MEKGFSWVYHLASQPFNYIMIIMMVTFVYIAQAILCALNCMLKTITQWTLTVAHRINAIMKERGSDPQCMHKIDCDGKSMQRGGGGGGGNRCSP